MRLFQVKDTNPEEFLSCPVTVQEKKRRRREAEVDTESEDAYYSTYSEELNFD